jgi:S-adenosylmethionine-dependent methyltransferase
MSVEFYYDQSPQDEWERLQRNKTEYAVTMRAFAEYFPLPPARVLDIGGGPGRYSLALAQQGYDVTLVDVSAQCLKFAEEKAEDAGIALTCIHGNALTLKFQREQFDIVLLMGPLYHLRTEEGRKKALHEAVRVLRKKGLICASFVTRYAPIRWAAAFEPDWVMTNNSQCNQIITEGKTSLARESFVNYSYFAHPKEINPFMEESGLESVDLIACEGVISFIDEKVNHVEEDAWKIWVDINYRLGKDSSVHGAAEHLLYIGKKR